MSRSITGQTRVAGVVGDPVRHSLSPTLHNAWLEAAGIDGVYVAFPAATSTFVDFVRGLRGGVVRGLNITAPFKEEALALADHAFDTATRAGAANLLIFEDNGRIIADNTDGEGLIYAFRSQTEGFDPGAGPVIILGAGGAARGAAAAFLAAGAPRVDFINRTPQKAQALAALFGDRARAVSLADGWNARREAAVVINATPLGLDGGIKGEQTIDDLPADCVVMDMVYRPLRTELIAQAEARGLRTVDGLQMLIGQAIPSFQSLFGRPPPPIDVRALALAVLETNR